MKMLFLFCTALAFAADVPRISFSKSFPGSIPPYYAITVDRTGVITYNESQDPDNAEKLQLEAAARERMFDLAEKLEHFKQPLESGLKIANLGEKILRWENGPEMVEAKFNYSLIEEAKTLNDWFDKIADSTRVLLELRRAAKHDKLGVNAATARIQVLWNTRRLLGTEQFLPLLDQIAGNEAYLHMARERAAEVADAIRATVK